MLKRAPLVYSPTKGWYVNLPTYVMLPNTFGPITKDKIHRDGIHPGTDPQDVLKLQPSVLVKIPDDTPMQEDGQIDQVGICHMYRDHPYYGTEHYILPQLRELDPADMQQVIEPTTLERIRAWLGRK